MNFRKEKPGMLRFGPFYYPKDFYGLADHHLLGKALKKHYEVKKVSENYDYLLAVRGIGMARVREVYNTFVPAGARQEVNVLGTLRTEVGANVDALLGPAGLTRGFKQNRIEQAFEPVTNAVLLLTQADDIGASKAGAFWKSKMFLAIHGWRMKRVWRRWMPNSKVPVDRLTDEAFAKAMEENSNTATFEDLGITEQDWAEFLDFSGAPTTA